MAVVLFIKHSRKCVSDEGLYIQTDGTANLNSSNVQRYCGRNQILPPISSLFNSITIGKSKAWEILLKKCTILSSTIYVIKIFAIYSKENGKQKMKLWIINQFLVTFAWIHIVLYKTYYNEVITFNRTQNNQTSSALSMWFYE